MLNYLCFMLVCSHVLLSEVHLMK